MQRESSTTSALPFASLSLQTQADSVIFHFQLQTWFEFWFVLRTQTRAAEKEYSRELVLPKGDGRCLNPTLIQRHRQDRASPSFREGTLLEWVLMHLPHLQRMPDLSQRKGPLWQYAAQPVATCCSEGARDSLNKTEVRSIGECVTFICNDYCRVSDISTHKCLLGVSIQFLNTCSDPRYLLACKVALTSIL